MVNPRVILIHGNGGGNGQDNWQPDVVEKLNQDGVDVMNPDFPDAQLAREKYWLPFLEKDLKADENTVLVGHSSGAIAAMRYAETHKILGSVLIGAYYTDLDDDGEKQSGYFDRPWNWDAIRSNQNWIIQFASADDPYIPIDHARHIHDQLQTEYYESNNQGHFMFDGPFDELVAALKEKLVK
jgi:uncharacterized protein